MLVLLLMCVLVGVRANQDIPHPSSLELAILTSPNIKSEHCKNDSTLLLQELQKLTLWAVQMFDASAKFPSGLLFGATHALGSYDECLMVGAGSAGAVRGKYCMTRIQLRPNPHFAWSGENTTETARALHHFLSAPMQPTGREPRVPEHHDDDPNQSVWVKVQRSVMDPSKRRRDVLHWGLCVPSSCGMEDVQTHLEHVLGPLRDSLGLEAHLRVERCEMEQTKPMEWPAILICSIFGVFLFLVTVGTAYDLTNSLKDGYKNQEWKAGTAGELMLCFSLYRNLKRLVRSEADEHHLKCMHGIKLYSMACVMLGHRLMFSLGSPIQNPEFVESYYRRLDTMLLLNGFIIVDTFFTITGFLVCYLLICALHQNVRVPLPALYLHRYLRLTPMYALVVGIYATLLEHMGSGPIWASKVGLEVERCKANWWANLLYINNYVNTSDMCMFQSWYVACDFQLFIISVPIVWLLWRHPRAGRVVLAGAILVSALIPFVVTVWGKLDALLLLYMNTLEDPISNRTFRMMYAPTHTRGSPYFIGMLFGYLTFLSRHRGLLVPQSLRRLCWLLMSLLPAVSLLSAWIFYLPGRDYMVLEAALYGSLHRVGWSLGISWVVFAVCTGGKGVVKLLLSMKPVIALSRLTYSAFLCHGALQLYTVATLRAPTYISIFNLMWMTLGDIMMAFAFGGALSLLFESPILGLEKILLRKKIKEAMDKAGGSSGDDSDTQNSPPSSVVELPVRRPLPKDPEAGPYPAYFRRTIPYDEGVAVISGVRVRDLKEGQQHLSL